MLLDFIRPTCGTARVLGGSGGDPSIRARVGDLPGDLNLLRAMTGGDAIAYYERLQGGGHETEAASLVDRFGLDPGRPVRELSIGNRRKVGLVLAFMSRPELLILDEPTSGLDPVLQEEFRNLLTERKLAGASIWLTSHLMAEVERVADRVGLIRDGALAKELAMNELRQHQATLRIEKPRGSCRSCLHPPSIPNRKGILEQASAVSANVCLEGMLQIRRYERTCAVTRDLEGGASPRAWRALLRIAPPFVHSGRSHSGWHAADSSLVDIGVHPRVTASRIGHGTVRTTMEIYARSSDTADREAAKLLQERFAHAFETDLRRPSRPGQVG
jgi:ABC-type multidrug transport system ATPase subunit